MLVADDQRIQLAAGRIERVDRRIDAESRDVARQDDRCVEVAECRRGRWIGQIVRGHIYGLNRRDRSCLRRCDPLLQTPHFLGKRRLIADRRRHAPEQRGHFGAGERVAINIVDEEQDVLAVVAKALGHRETRQADTQPVTRRLVHLPEHHRHLRLREIVHLDDARFRHLVIEIVAFARALADAGEH